MDSVKNLVVLLTNADSKKERQPASPSCLAEAVAFLCSYDKTVCTEVICFKKGYWTSLMGCSIRTVHRKRQPSDQNKRASEIIGTSKRGFRDISCWKMMGEKKECYREWSCKGKERRAGIFVSGCNCPLKTHNRSFPSLGVQITPSNHLKQCDYQLPRVQYQNCRRYYSNLNRLLVIRLQTIGIIFL